MCVPYATCRPNLRLCENSDRAFAVLRYLLDEQIQELAHIPKEDRSRIEESGKSGTEAVGRRRLAVLHTKDLLHDERGPTIIQRVCQMYKQDYSCLNYTVPEICQS